MANDSIQYTNSKVQPKDFTSGWKIAIVLTGLGVSLPILYLGAEMSLALGFENALMAFGIATAVLTTLCLVTTVIGSRSRLSTYMILRFPFGKQGAKAVNLFMGISLLGWFSVALEFLSAAIVDTAQVLTNVVIPLWSVIVFGSVLITVTTIYGIRTLEKLANITVPLLLMFLIYVVYVALGSNTIAPIDIESTVPEMTFFDGVSALIGSSILVPVLMADFSRYIVNDKQSLFSVIGIAVGTPLVWIIAAVLATQTGEVDIISIMKSFSLVLPAFILIFISTWMTNATNLYSVALTFATIIEDWTYTRLTIACSILGTTLALLNFSNYFIDFLNILGIFSPSIAAIYIIDFFYVKNQAYDLDSIEAWGIKGLVSWGVSSFIAFCTYFNWITLSGAYFVDAFLIGGLLYFLWNLKSIEE